MGNWTASFAERLLLILRWTPFPAMSGRVSKQGAAATSVQPLQALDPLLAVSGRDSKKGLFNLTLNVLPLVLSVPFPHIEPAPLSALSVPVLCACLLVRVAFFWQMPFPKHCSE